MKLNADVVKKSDVGLVDVKDVEPLMESNNFKLDDDNLFEIDQARNHWDNLYELRERANRVFEFIRGNQWSDKIKDPEGTGYISEEELLLRRNKNPMKQNLMWQAQQNIIGRFRTSPTKPFVIARSKSEDDSSEMMNNAMYYAYQVNDLRELDAKQLQICLFAGISAQKIKYKYIKTLDKEDIEIENVPYHNIFFNTDVNDPRMRDLKMIGQFMDLDISEIISTFAKDKEDEEEIRRIYQQNIATFYHNQQNALSASYYNSQDFYIPKDLNKCRVYEIWKQKSEWRLYVHDPLDASYKFYDLEDQEIFEVENQRRMVKAIEKGYAPEDAALLDIKEKYESFWYVKYLTPFGHCLFEGETPYDHQEHPFWLHLYPLINGEVFGPMHNMVDQQKYVNRLMIIMDFLVTTGAKGIMLLPESAIPKGMSPDDFSDKWTKFDEVIVYKPNKDGAKPEQIATQSMPVGLKELLAMQMQLFQDVGGVHPAIQGKPPKSGTPASLYMQEAQNASLSTADFFESFSSGLKRRNLKILKTITQYYKEERNLAISKKHIGDANFIYDPEKTRDIEYDIVMSESPDSPVFRSIIEERLDNLLQLGAINIEQWLEVTTMPFADKLKGIIHDYKSQQLPEAMGEMMGETGADPNSMAMLNKALGRG